jgi:exonuclease III
MKIATWNLERPTLNGKKTAAIIETLNKLNADVIVLTETNVFIDLGNEYIVKHTEKDSLSYFKDEERRVSIYSKFPIAKQIETFRADTSLCLVLETPKGLLTIYGTVIGNRGNRGYNFKEDLEMQLLDFKKIGLNKNFCVLGDFNISFCDNYYTVKESREKLKNTFNDLQMEILTENLPENIDHIALSKAFIGQSKIKVCWWNNPKEQQALSDHKGVWGKIEE